MAEEFYYISSSDDDADEDDDDASGSQDDDDLDENPIMDEVDGRDNACSWSSATVITEKSLLAAQNVDLRKVMNLLAIKEHHARTLLMYHRWDVERIFELLDQKGRDLLFAEAGVSNAVNTGTLHCTTGSVTCKICFEDVSSGVMTVMDCGHSYCKDCWTEYFFTKINDGECRSIRCMTPKCGALCDEATVKRLVSENYPDLVDRFDRSLLESYIEDNNKVKWCPSVPHCGNAIRVEGEICCEVECKCGNQFCFNCSAEAHSPCSCLMWELWSKKCHDESANVNWISVNTKPCPKCHKSVEKNGGCNLVVCVCGQAFCWLCAAATGRNHTWSSISGHSCGRYKEDLEKRVEDARKNLNRYLHYYNRYKAHKDSLKQEDKLRDTIKVRVAESENKDSKIKDYSWVINGLHRLSRSRRILSYSYPFAFYMFGDELFMDEMTSEEKEIKKNLFEDQQQQLEYNVEKLSMLLEKEFQCLTDAEVIDFMGQIINMSTVVDTLCKEMYKCIENDLLYPLQSTHNISSYKSKGLERASEVSISYDLDQNSSSTELDGMQNLKTNNTSDVKVTGSFNQFMCDDVFSR